MKTKKTKAKKPPRQTPKKRSRVMNQQQKVDAPSRGRAKEIPAHLRSKPTETGVLHTAMEDPTNDIVALEDKATSAASGSILRIDSEYMTVKDATDLNNLKVERGSFGSLIAPHAAGASVPIWADPGLPKYDEAAGARAVVLRQFDPWAADEDPLLSRREHVADLKARAQANEDRNLDEYEKQAETAREITRKHREFEREMLLANERDEPVVVAKK